jgi:hypothetical protein
MTRRRTLALHAIVLVLLSAYPVSLLLRANLGIVPVAPSGIALILILNLALAGFLVMMLRAVASDIVARMAWTSVVMLLVGLYVAIIQQIAAFGWRVRPDQPLTIACYVMIAVTIATAIVRPRLSRRRDPVPMIVISAVLFSTNTALGVGRILPFESAAGQARWQSTAATLIDTAVQPGFHPRSPARDIYYVILDGFGGSGTLQRLYTVDATAFEGGLTAQGFRVVQDARSNYVQTYLSLASTLNLDYLDGIAAAVGPASTDRFPLAHLIQQNALMALAKRAGYRVIGIGSDYSATEYLSNVDRCICDQHGSSSNVQTLLAASPMFAPFVGPRVIDGHRLKVLTAFSELERAGMSDEPVFVFAHIIAPHPPFVFDEDGTRPNTAPHAWFQDGSAFGGSRADYRQGYRNQVQFLMNRLSAVVESLLRHKGPSPVIVLHGDHGPGMRLDWNSAERTDMDERTSIFAAYRLPGAAQLPYTGMTPINGARLLSNAYFGTDFRPLEDKSYYSSWGRPYALVPISTSSGSRGMNAAQR